jgi:hypothetical protein
MVDIDIRYIAGVINYAEYSRQAPRPIEPGKIKILADC